MDRPRTIDEAAVIATLHAMEDYVRLIAAERDDAWLRLADGERLAPELLALLRRLLPWVDDVAVTSLRGRQFADDIRGTLAKADGEEPR